MIYTELPTLSKMSKYGGFFGSNFPVISPNTAKYGPEKRIGHVFEIVILSVLPRDQERKFISNFFSVSKGFRKALKVFIKLFGTSQRGTNTKI